MEPNRQRNQTYGETPEIPRSQAIDSDGVQRAKRVQNSTAGGANRRFLSPLCPFSTPSHVGVTRFQFFEPHPTHAQTTRTRPNGGRRDETSSPAPLSEHQAAQLWLARPRSRRSLRRQQEYVWQGGHPSKIRWLGGYSPNKPPFGVRSCEVAMIHPGIMAIVAWPNDHNFWANSSR